MKRRRHTPEQIVRKLREVERLLGEGQTIAEAAKQVEISEQTYHRWRNQYGGMKADDAKRLRELERENARLGRIVADKELEIDALKEIARGTGKPVAPARGGPHVAGPLGSRRREAVRMLQDPSDCRNGGHAGSPASTAPRQRRLPARGRGDDALRTELHAFSRGHPRWGYRRAWATLREEGWSMNRKRVQRLWREEGLRVPLKRRKRQRLRDSVQPARWLRAERPNHVWALDFQFDQTADGRVLKLNIVDEHTREALAMVATRRINADATAATLDRIVAVRGTAPGYIRCDIQSGSALRMLAGPAGRSQDQRVRHLSAVVDSATGAQCDSFPVDHEAGGAIAGDEASCWEPGDRANEPGSLLANVRYDVPVRWPARIE